MASDRIPVIDVAVRLELAEVFKNQLDLTDNKKNKFFTYDSEIYSENFIYHSDYSFEHQNVAYVNDQPVMCVFSFNIRNIVKIFNLLSLRETKPKLNGIRVYPNMTVPMHVDIDRYQNGRNNPTLVYSLTKSDGCILFSNKKDGSAQVTINSNEDFIFNPGDIVHGAKSNKTCIDLLQIQL
jgi:hypothetical protein